MLSERIRLLRHQQNLTQAQLADKLGLAKTTIASYEQGKNEPNVETLVKIATYFDTSIDYLLGYSNYKNPHVESQFEEILKASKYRQMVDLFQNIISCYDDLSDLYTENNISSIQPLNKQLLNILSSITSVFSNITVSIPDSIEDIGFNIGSLSTAIHTNIDTIFFSSELAKIYQNLSNITTE